MLFLKVSFNPFIYLAAAYLAESQGQTENKNKSHQASVLKVLLNTV